jgi:hypothetical protein
MLRMAKSSDKTLSYLDTSSDVLRDPVSGILDQHEQQQFNRLTSRCDPGNPFLAHQLGRKYIVDRGSTRCSDWRRLHLVHGCTVFNSTEILSC